jgi:DNA modification methylase
VIKSETTLWQGDCLELMGDIPDGSIDCVITDPPYGTTQCKWDSVIPFEPMWAHLKRVTKSNGAIVLFGSQPFTSALIMSNVKMFRYQWVWVKSTITNFVNAKKMPLRKHEAVLVFSKDPSAYYPQNLIKLGEKKKQGKRGSGNFSAATVKEYTQENTNYPSDVLYQGSVSVNDHPTQKPVDLIKYLAKTYTLEGETILDFTMGSGTTGVACKQLGRHFIGIEQDPEYFKIAKKRISEPAQIPLKR